MTSPNSLSSNPTATADIASWLSASAPDTAPAGDLWSRIVAARQRQLVSRRWRRSSGVAAAVALLALGVWSWSALQPSPPADALSRWQEQSRMLEREWQAVALTDPQQSHGYARLQGVDRALQQAYDRGASRDELAPLWAQRAFLLRRLLANAQRSATPESTDIVSI